VKKVIGFSKNPHHLVDVRRAALFLAGDAYSRPDVESIHTTTRLLTRAAFYSKL